MPRLPNVPFPQCYLHQFVVVYLPHFLDEEGDMADAWSGLVEPRHLSEDQRTLHLGARRQAIPEEDVFDSVLAFELAMKKRTLEKQETVLERHRESLRIHEQLMADTRAAIDALTIAIGVANAG